MKMKKVIIALVMLTGIAMLPSTTYGQSNSNQQIADEIIGMVKAQWAAQAADPGNVTEGFKNVADDYTEFNATFSTRIDGKSVSMSLSEPAGKAPGRRVAAEMLNPKVQVYGDAAILTYNFAGYNKNKEGELKPFRAKSTRVYVKQGGKWKMVHANFGADPSPEN
jgi:ketosteroid isomerase-like protein